MGLNTKRADLRFTDIRKFVSGGKRIISGIASAPSVDRQGDIVVPTGGRWTLPLPLLWQHRHDAPIGWVREAVATADGVKIRAELAIGIGKADEVWAMVESGLVDSFSIGFLGIKGEPIATGTRWNAWELLECSIVVIPANRDAKIGRSVQLATPIRILGYSVKLGVPEKYRPGVALIKVKKPVQLLLPGGAIRLIPRRPK